MVNRGQRAKGRSPLFKCQKKSGEHPGYEGEEYPHAAASHLRPTSIDFRSTNKSRKNVLMRLFNSAADESNSRSEASGLFPLAVARHRSQWAEGTGQSIASIDEECVAEKYGTRSPLEQI